MTAQDIMSLSKMERQTEYYNDIKLPDHNPAALVALVGIMEKYFVGNKV